ncbi:DEAD/DEAH box helicase [Ligilactobacillus apodemi]|uniref:DEAD/DEAH box helicase n=1 Tax=Ligilactobacillus apodemi TaxID=307126 RepID=UPI00214AA2BE|nr:DEAD/DEAH box helicase [Ligilactobacillus apodemi]MCR1901605.1 DEAD/DEAH box helicase [Ligilactobacillus apodemi]
MNPKFTAYFEEQGFKELSPIQAKTQALLAKGENVLGLAPTGSGKTLAYTLPLLEQLLPEDGTQLLVVAPSQELAAQLTNVIRPWAKLIDLNVLALIGGANVKRQIEKLKKRPEIVIGTPGRLLNLINDKKLKLHKLVAVVFDEADDLLGEKETLADCREIISHAPGETSLSFFSATKAPIFSELHRWFGVEPVVVDVRNEDHTQGEVVHYLLETPQRKRSEMLRKLAQVEGFFALVFFKQSATLNDVFEKLKHSNVSVARLNSEQRQVEREQALRALKKREISLLLTTDVAARGLDIPDLPAVVNYDLPKDTNTYIHRVGRTGRMGADGIVVDLGNEHDLRLFKQLIKDEGYDIRAGYLYQRQLIDDQEELVKLRTQVKAKVKKEVRAKRKQNTVEPKKIVTEKKKHKKKRKRDQKNKGKRKKK